MSYRFQALKSALADLSGKPLEDRTFLMWIDDNLLSRLTNGKFTGKNAFHPTYVIKEKGESSIACPCSTAESNKTTKSYINQGTVLEDAVPDRYYIPRKTYILHNIPFVIPRTGADWLEFWSNINGIGRVPSEEIVGSQWTSWWAYFSNTSLKKSN